MARGGKGLSMGNGGIGGSGIFGIFGTTVRCDSKDDSWFCTLAKLVNGLIMILFLIFVLYLVYIFFIKSSSGKRVGGRNS